MEILTDFSLKNYNTFGIEAKAKQFEIVNEVFKPLKRWGYVIIIEYFRHLFFVEFSLF